METAEAGASKDGSLSANFRAACQRPLLASENPLLKGSWTKRRAFSASRRTRSRKPLVAFCVNGTIARYRRRNPENTRVFVHALSLAPPHRRDTALPVTRRWPVVRKTGRTAAPQRCRSGHESRVASTSASPLRCNPQERQKKHPAPFKTRAAGKPRSSHLPILARRSQLRPLSLAARRLALGPPPHDTGAHATASRRPSLQRAAFITARMRLGSFAWRPPKETPARLRKDPRCGGPAQPRQPP